MHIRLLSEYTGLNLYRGFKSLPLRHKRLKSATCSKCGWLIFFVRVTLQREHAYIKTYTAIVIPSLNDWVHISLGGLKSCVVMVTI